MFSQTCVSHFVHREGLCIPACTLAGGVCILYPSMHLGRIGGVDRCVGKGGVDMGRAVYTPYWNESLYANVSSSQILFMAVVVVDDMFPLPSVEEFSFLYHFVVQGSFMDIRLSLH